MLPPSASSRAAFSAGAATPGRGGLRGLRMGELLSGGTCAGAGLQDF